MHCIGKFHQVLRATERIRSQLDQPGPYVTKLDVKVQELAAAGMRLEAR
jgi:hypothetical protein